MRVPVLVCDQRSGRVTRKERCTAAMKPGDLLRIHFFPPFQSRPVFQLRKVCSIIFLHLSIGQTGFCDELRAQKANDDGELKGPVEAADSSKEQPRRDAPKSPSNTSPDGLTTWLNLPSGIKVEVEHRSRYETSANRFRQGEVGGTNSSRCEPASGSRSRSAMTLYAFRWKLKTREPG